MYDCLPSAKAKDKKKLFNAPCPGLCAKVQFGLKVSPTERHPAGTQGIKTFSFTPAALVQTYKIFKTGFLLQGLQFGGTAVRGLLSGDLGVKAASFFLLSLALSAIESMKLYKIIKEALSAFGKGIQDSTLGPTVPIAMLDFEGYKRTCKKRPSLKTFHPETNLCTWLVDKLFDQ